MNTETLEHPLIMQQAMVRLTELEREVQELRRSLMAYLPPPALIPQDDGTGTRAQQALVPLATTRDSWHVTCFNHFELRCMGRAVAPCSSRRGWSILQYLLATSGYTATSDVLIEQFWPDACATAGAHNLQMAIHTLRDSLRGCGPSGSDETILFRNGRYLINPSLSIVQDIDAFRAAYARGTQAATAGHQVEAQLAYEEAHACCLGEYLADSRYDDWTLGRRADLQDMRLHMLGWLCTYYGEAADWEHAAICCREILHIDPYREDASRQLMRSHAACGHLADVHRTYCRLRDQLQHDLDIDPAPETSEIYQSLVKQRGTPKAKN